MDATAEETVHDMIILRALMSMGKCLGRKLKFSLDVVVLKGHCLLIKGMSWLSWLSGSRIRNFQIFHWPIFKFLHGKN